jgi:glycosyltransferase involved in cell wall biosynthesis
MHIGIVGPIHLPSITNFKKDIEQFSPIGMGGTPVNHQINALLEMGHKVSVFSLSPEMEIGESFEWSNLNLNIFVGPFRKSARQRCLDLFRIERNYLENKIRLIKPEIIHAHWQYEWGWAALNSTIPTLLTCHDAPLEVLKSQRDLYRLVRAIMAFIVLKKATYLTSVSPHTAIGLRLFTKKQIEIIPNFEPENVFSLYDPEKRKYIIDQKIKIGMINNSFFGLKNVKNGILAFNNFKEIFPNAELHLFGAQHGINEDAYNWTMANAPSSSGIFFQGQIPFQNLMKELSNMTILLHTSKEESCPMVIIEAMAMGIPIVAGNNSGGIPWMLNSGGGELTDIMNISSINASLLKIVETPNIYQAFSNKAREEALKKFSQHVVMKKYLEQYDKISYAKNK